MMKRIKQCISSLGRCITGENNPLTKFASLRYREGKYLSAAALTLYSIPLRGLDKIQYGFVTSADYYDELQALLTVDKAEGFDLVRIGKENDGGYIYLNDFREGGIAYSFGICDDVSWDKDMASRGYDVFMYDHTIERLPEENSRFHFFRQGIADGATKDERLKTLEYLIAQNHHQEKQNMILKMDVEGAEWGFLESVKPETLMQFSQMTFELHGMFSPSKSERILNVLSKINKTHQLVHIHANNVSNYVTLNGKHFCELFEVTYILREKYKFSGSYDVFLPLKIDMPNVKEWPEIELGYWNRKVPFDGKLICSTKHYLNSEA